ncbi:hypothetical protein ABTK84_19345, partial [Acinetobacter baumannii]
RFVLLGALTAELNAHHASIAAPAKIDSFQIILKDITMRGYSADRDGAEAFDEWIMWLSESKADLHFASSRFFGIESAPQALHEACDGKLKGV